jgi:hypothetical protein
MRRYSDEGSVRQVSNEWLCVATYVAGEFMLCNNLEFEGLDRIIYLTFCNL